MKKLITELEGIIQDTSDKGIVAALSFGLSNNLLSKGSTFANSLLHGDYGYYARGYLTPKQVNAAMNLLRGAINSQPTPLDKVCNFKKVYELLIAAREHLKYPKLMLSMGEHTLKVYLSGSKSRVPDVVNLVVPAAYREDDVWLGRIYPDGRWEHRQTSKELLSEAKELLSKLAENPAATAAESGHLSGNCCFCHRPLKDQRSTEVGYGPVCADKWSMPWGA